MCFLQPQLKRTEVALALNMLQDGVLGTRNWTKLLYQSQLLETLEHDVAKYLTIFTSPQMQMTREHEYLTHHIFIYFVAAGL